MITRKPCVLVYTYRADEDYLGEILSGIEEEGVPFQVLEKEGSLDELAFLAARESVLGSGIGMRGQEVAMQMAGLPRGQNVFELAFPTFRQCRILGANSARAVKKVSFRSLSEGGEP